MTKLERLILTRTPIRGFVNRTKYWMLPGFEGVPLYEVLRFFRKEIRLEGLQQRASAIAYNFILSIPPTCLFLFTLIPNLPFISKKSMRSQLHGLIMDIVPAKTYNTGLIKFVDSFINGNKIGLISSGFILSLFFASNAVMGLMRSFNKTHAGFEQRKGLHRRWVAIKLTMIMFSLFLICLLLLITQNNILNFIGVKNPVIKALILNGKWIIITGLIYYTFAFIYRYAPATQKRWKLLSPGAIIATFLSILATIGFSLFINNFGKYNVLYGSIGTIMVVMILIFINSFVILIGFEFNVSIKMLRALAEEREQNEIEAGLKNIKL
ncbi:YihY/virulence factor BrkB family protein [soil metagenome]